MSIFTRAGGESGKCRAFLKIQDGCSGRCTYCIIPSLRGPSRSRDAAEILDEAARAVRAGVKELVLTGIETGAYNRMPLGELAARVAAVSGVERIRLGSLDPACVTTALAARLSALPNFMPHFHLSLQSGSDSVLRRMRRPYDSAARSAPLIGCGTRSRPDAQRGCDLRLPGETEENSRRPARLSSNSFAHIHAFPFPRGGTPAAAMEDVCRRRGEGAQRAPDRAGGAGAGARLCSRIGGTETVLLERTDGDCGSGHTAGFLECVVRGAGLRVGELTAVRVTGVENGVLLAVSESL
ncbi:MAG: radical SAM protein [Acutalibacteraceae bacterium]